MLTKDLLRFRVKDGDQVEPGLLKTTPAIVEQAQQLLDHWREQVGRTLDEAEDGQDPILHEGRSLMIAKGLAKLVQDACTVRDADDCGALRLAAFAASAEQLRAPATDAHEHRQRIASTVGLDADTIGPALYADLPGRAVVQAAPSFAPSELLARYNLAQCQGLLLTAREMTVEVLDQDPGNRRRLLAALRWQRLLAEVKDGPVLTLGIAGPGAVLDQATRYGLQLALFLPAVAALPAWRLRAQVRPSREHGWLTLSLSEATGLKGDNRFLGHIPAELRRLLDDIAIAKPGWVVLPGEPLPVPGSSELVVPDIRITTPTGEHQLELFHRWHDHALDRRLAQLAHLPGLCIGVDRPLAKRHPGLAEDPRFFQAGFLFSDLPSARMVVQALERDRSRVGTADARDSAGI